MGESVLIYDCEILRAIGAQENPAIEYCAGWRDFAGMGVTCVCAWDGADERYRVFKADNLEEFSRLASEREEVVSYNGLSFDDKLMEANGVSVRTTYDLLVECWRAAGLPPVYTPRVTPKGYTLEEVARRTLGRGKSGSGAEAPVLWQRGQRGRVIDYCLNDVQLTRELWERRGCIIGHNDRPLRLRYSSRVEVWPEAAGAAATTPPPDNSEVRRGHEERRQATADATAHRLLGMPVHYVAPTGREFAAMIITSPERGPDQAAGFIDLTIVEVPGGSEEGRVRVVRGVPRAENGEPGTWHPRG